MTINDFAPLLSPVDSETADAGAGAVEPQKKELRSVDSDADKSDTLTHEAALKELKVVRAEAAKYRTKSRELEDAAAERAKAEAAIAEQEAIKRGEYEELYSAVKAESDALKQQLSAVSDKLSPYLEREEQRRTELLKTLPEEVRERFADAPYENIEYLAKMAKSTTTESGTLSTSTGGSQQQTTQEALRGLSGQQLMEKYLNIQR